MELNREQIVKAMEHCSGATKGLCNGCPLRDYSSCTELICEYALALIRELTEENEAQAETITNLIETITTLPVKKVKSKVAIFPKFKCETERIDAYTVQKMQERLKQQVFSDANPHDYEILHLFIDGVAKELLEEGSGNG